MQDFIKQDVFFFITTVAVLTVTLLLAIFLVYVIRIARSVDKITTKVRQETDMISEELGELRRNIKKEGVRLKHLANFANNLVKRNKL